MTDLRERVSRIVLADVGERLALLSLADSDVTGDFDLVHTGVLDSMGFVDLLSKLEDELGFEIRIPDGKIGEATTLNGLVEVVRASAPRDDD